jgi:hypothetical protein
MKHNILYSTEADCLEEQELLRYAEGSADVVLLRKVELHLSDCKMCSDVLEGLQIIGNHDFIHYNKSVKIKIKDKYAPAKVVKFADYMPWAVAASLLIGIGFWFWKTPQNVGNPIVLDEKKQDAISNILQNENSIKLEKDAKLADTKVAPKRFYDFKNPQKRTTSPIASELTDISDTKVNEQKTEVVQAEEVSQNVGNQAVENGGAYNNVKKRVTEASMESEKIAKDEIVFAPVPNMEMPENKANMPLPAPIQNSNIFSPKAKNIYKKPKVETVKPSAKSNANAKQNIQFNNQEERLLEQGIKQYIASDYKGALLTFETVLKQFTKSEAATFYKGATQCADNQCLEGVNTLSVFVTTYSETSNFYSEAAWLTANCQLSLMQRETAKLLLQQLSEYYNPRQEDAKKLLEKLKK